MKYAETMFDIPNAFKASPLTKEELGTFYYDGTMRVRTGDLYVSPIEDIYDACKMPSEHNVFLLLGHKGCGKSTELNHMSARLIGEGYEVLTVQCGSDLDLNNPLYADLLILMGDALLKIADKTGCELDDKTVKTINDFWKVSGETEKNVSYEKDAEVNAEISAKTPGVIVRFLKAFAAIKADLRYSEENRTCYREHIARRSSEWVFALRKIADSITEKLNGKQPILIFEDLDKLNPKDAWDVFYNYAATLTGVSFPVIYTFPIALSYDPKFTALEGYFTAKTLPMIKQADIHGEPYEDGYQTILRIIEMRADMKLFDEAALKLMIQKTGGSLRDLFSAINACSQRANRRKSEKIETDDAENALEQLKTSLTRRIERRHYDFLAQIYRGNREKIEDQKMLLEMLQANTVLEYNGRRWHNVHPLVADFLLEQGLIDND